ncbi:MAG: excinuclease ABC subunit UvrB [Bacilli bacterium]
MFKIHSKYSPAGDQPKAIKQLVEGIEKGEKHQVLLGATGTGKTFTMANVIEKVNKPTLILAHNKTLAGQLYSEFKELFPNNAVEYFVSYYDYFQPEAYVPSSDTYIEKDSSINDEIDELRHRATSNLINRKDVIVVASVSCIYGIGEIENYKKMTETLNIGDIKDRDKVILKLIDMLYERNNIDFKRGTFRVNGDVLDIVPVSERSKGVRIEFFGDEIDAIKEFDILTGKILNTKKSVTLFAASHFVTDNDKITETINRIKKELESRLKYFNDEGKLLEAERLKNRCEYDIAMLSETGFCTGIENYSRHVALKDEGEMLTCLIDYFGNDFLLIVDESHVTLPQVRAMFNGDRSRKQTLVDYGFRLPSALDNRPLRFSEFEEKIKNAVYVSATPEEYELGKTNGDFIQQIIRPTHLLDPVIEVRKSTNQIDDLVNELNIRIEKKEKVLITTLTIRMSEELTNYLKDINIKVAYLHSEIKTLDRMRIIRDLRLGKYDCIVGINLLREGLDIPEVSLVAILDADKQGFLRSRTSLIQTIGRAARNIEGKVIMYADNISNAMREAIDETSRRRTIQKEFNEENNVIPKAIKKEIKDLISNIEEITETEFTESKSVEEMIKTMEKEMNKAAKDMDFEKAIKLRDTLFELRNQ